MARTARLEDLKRELWLRLRESGKIIWTTKEGKEIPIKDMSFSHLCNTIRMIEKAEEEWEMYLEALGGDWEG